MLWIVLLLSYRLKNYTDFPHQRIFIWLDISFISGSNWNNENNYQNHNKETVFDCLPSVQEWLSGEKLASNYIKASVRS